MENDRGVLVVSVGVSRHLLEKAATASLGWDYCEEAVTEGQNSLLGRAAVTPGRGYTSIPQALRRVRVCLPLVLLSPMPYEIGSSAQASYSSHLWKSTCAPYFLGCPERTPLFFKN